MNSSFTLWAPYVGVAVVAIVYLAFRLHGEAMKYVSEVKFFLEQKTLAYNKTNASLAVVKSKMAEVQRRSNQIEKENARLRKSLEIMNQFVDERKYKTKEFQDGPSKVEMDPSKLEKLEQELSSINNVLNRDLKVQLKNYAREVDWLTKRLTEVQSDLIKVTGEEKNTSLADLTYKNAA